MLLPEQLNVFTAWGIKGKKMRQGNALRGSTEAGDQTTGTRYFDSQRAPKESIATASLVGQACSKQGVFTSSQNSEKKVPMAAAQAKLWPYVRLRGSIWQYVEAHDGKFSQLSLSEHVVYSRQLAKE